MTGRERNVMTSSQKSSAKFVAPNTCAFCEDIEREHGMRFHREIKKWGGWIAPSNAQRLERMKNNRALGLKNTTPYWNQNKPKETN